MSILYVYPIYAYIHITTGMEYPVTVNRHRRACPGCSWVPTMQTTMSYSLMCLRSLELVDISIGDAGACSLATALGAGCNALMLDDVALVSDAIGEVGAGAFARAVDAGAMKGHDGGGRLWLAGSFCQTGGQGFTALTKACDKSGLPLELEHGIPWGM